ncbi:hypothetical protein F511_35398 [Dorcoceras hygrometricum]|uniref:Uncharacterized protein n=1 Tax=Dorcoceras hygrometricum TaxID=472368 RepID=A0A2Z7ADG4_9LAMI|nr:hypothetical protein F511_35398 [Dorcoceras hygrometricum]
MVAVAQEAVPIQMIETLTVAPSAENISDQPAGETDGVKGVDADVDALTTKIDEQVADPSAIDETSVRECFYPAVEVPAEETRCSSADDVYFIIQQVIEETREVDASADRNQPSSTEERHWFDLPYEDLIEKWAVERPVVTASDTDEEDVPMNVGTADGDHHVQCLEEKSAVNDDLLNADEQMSLDDIIFTIPVDVPLPSSSMEITKIHMGEKIKIPEVTERTWFLNSLPRIPAYHKGKAILVEKDPIKGNPVQEHYFLINAYIDLLVELRAKIIDEVAQFFHSFSLRKLATFNIEDMYKKEEQVLSWGETESPQVAIQRKLYILIKYREVLVWKFLQSWRANFVPGQGSSAVDLKVIELLSDLHLFILEELAKEPRAHGLLWTKTCCSTIFEGSPGDRGAIISNEVPRHRQYDDTLPSVSAFFLVLKKIWADVCFEVVDFCASRRLLPVGSVNLCRGLTLGGPVFQVAYRQSPVFAFRVSQFCSEARQEGRSIDDVQTMSFNELRKTILAQNASIFVGLADVRKEISPELDSKYECGAGWYPVNGLAISLGVLMQAVGDLRVSHRSDQLRNADTKPARAPNRPAPSIQHISKLNPACTYTVKPRAVHL